MIGALAKNDKFNPLGQRFPRSPPDAAELSMADDAATPEADISRPRGNQTFRLIDWYLVPRAAFQCWRGCDHKSKATLTGR